MVRSGGTRSAAIRRSSRAGWPTAVDRDYAGSGFDRGHLLPSADRDDSRAENDATFYLSNVSPQYPKLNRNQWRLLEEQVRRWADRYDSIYVVTGGELEPGLRRIRGGTGIPRHYFKALLGASRKGLACDCLQASERRLAGRKLDRLFAERRPLGGTDRNRLFSGAARQHRAPRREPGRCRILEVGAGRFPSSARFAWPGASSVFDEARIGPRRYGFCRAGFRRFVVVVAAGRGAPCFPARLRQTFAGPGRRFARGIFRFTVFPARTEGYGAIFAIAV